MATVERVRYPKRPGQVVTDVLHERPPPLRCKLPETASFDRGDCCRISKWPAGAYATDAHAQRRGIGTKLLEPVSREATRDGLACYLEASHEQNVPLYERHGSTILSEVHLPKSGPVVRAMRRDPSASS